jgi:response regulator RpfG family c-di-GMP phosphodiesterase
MNISILYIDDEPINIQLFEINFKKYYDVYSATSGKEALDIIQNTTINFLVSDYRMPEMDGLELIKEVKKIKPEVKCYLLSAYPESEIRNYIGDNNFLDGFIAKPWRKEEILKIIQKETS